MSHASIRWLIAIAAAAGCTSGAAAARLDSVALAEADGAAGSRDLQALSEARATLRQFAPDSVIDQIYLWQSLREPLKVCFFRGGIQIRERIANAARGWELPGSAVRFDFGKGPKLRDCGSEVSQIRIGFDHRGYSSRIGRWSELIPQTRHSMNFQNWDIEDVDDVKLRQVVLHEFGHALGLHHEHQNPWSACEEQFDWDYLRTVLTGPDYGWAEVDIEKNMRRLHPEKIDASDFDPTSIMIYSFPPQFYKEGDKATCYHTENYVISPDDRAAILKVYPADRNVMVAQRVNALEQLKAAIATARMNTALQADLLLPLNRLTTELRYGRH